MARIRTLTSEQRSASSPHPTTVDARWQVVRPSGGDVLLQISTYGSDQRQSEPKVSQTVQLDRAVAAELVEILRRTFDL